MIIDQISRISLYLNVHPGLSKITEFLKNIDPNIINGRYEIDDDRVFALVQEPVQTKYELTNLEAHRKYIDMHVLLKGHEYIGIANLNKQKVKGKYDKGNDIVFYADDGSNKIHLHQNYFCFIWPHEGHKPNCYSDIPCNTRKVVFKLKV